MKTDMESQKLIAGIEPLVEKADDESSSVLTFHVTNQSDMDVEMLIWNTPFEKILSADIFIVELNGESVAYIGRKVKRGTPQSGSYLTVHAGERLDKTIDMSLYYDMEKAGEYTITFNPVAINGVHQLNQETPIQLVPATVKLDVAGQ
ncbi:MAG: hypothetical protein V3U76_03055 [Granulosicoccus sp.]